MAANVGLPPGGGIHSPLKAMALADNRPLGLMASTNRQTEVEPMGARRPQRDRHNLIVATGWAADWVD